MAVNDIVMSAAGASGPATFVEDVFSTWLYTGNSSTQTIANGIDLSSKGGLVWVKDRITALGHCLFDTSNGATKFLTSNNTSSIATYSDTLTSFNSNGFSLGADSSTYRVNGSGETYASWTFREQPKFFDVVTYTGNGVAGRQIAHSLGSAPGCIIVKRTDTTGDWQVYHIGLPLPGYQDTKLNSTAASTIQDGRWWYGSTTTWQNATNMTVGDDASVNASGGTYVAYLFAHNAGGFGASGTDNVISCGSMTFGGTSIQSFNLGYEPQWLLVKKTDSAQGWWLFDNMRGMSYSSALGLQPNVSNAETNFGANGVYPTATGVDIETSNFGAGTYIYIAIRRPMKPPTTGTQVFAPVTASIPNSAYTVTTGFPVDMSWSKNRDVGYTCSSYDRLRGKWAFLSPTTTSAEAVYSTPYMAFDSNTKIVDNYNWIQAYNGPTAYWNFKRAAGFFDVVCFTPTGVAHMESHNLNAVPELIIGKGLDSTFNWYVYSAPLGNTKALYFNTDNSFITGTYLWNNTSPTSTAFSLGASGLNSSASSSVIAYLFATVAGVSKVGSYTGTGATLNIDAGFTTGARFVMIKRTDDVGNWFVWDTARGMVSGTDPRLALNDTAAESNANWVYTASSGFQIITTDATVNASGGSYIYLAIA